MIAFIIILVLISLSFTSIILYMLRYNTQVKMNFIDKEIKYCEEIKKLLEENIEIREGRVKLRKENIELRKSKLSK